jgi:hypothetical protein
MGMPKPELEFFRPDNIPWEAVVGSAQMGAGGPGVTQRILSKDEKGGITRLLRFEPGVETKETLRHDFWEEVWILEGELVDLAKQQTFTAGMYACRPPGMPHGPYRVTQPTMTLEMRYYEPAAARPAARRRPAAAHGGGRRRATPKARKAIARGRKGRRR